MRHRGLLVIVALLTGAAMTFPTRTDAQILKRLKKAAKEAVANEAESQVDRMIRGAIRCLVDDPVCFEEAKASGKDVVFVDDDGKVISDDEGAPITDRAEAVAAAPPPPVPGDGVWANYDFVPGENVLFYEDYAQSKVGDFPQRLEFLNGNMDIVETAGKPWLRATAGSAFAVQLGQTLPDRFTLEFPVAWRHGNQWMRVLFADYQGPVAPRRLGGYARPHLQIDERNTGIFDFQKDEPHATTAIIGKITSGEVMVRLMADGRHIKVFVGEQRVANVPQVDIGRATKVWFVIADAKEELPMFVGPIRIAGGGADLYDKLEADGRVTTHGILFATNSDRIRPESTPTLKEIGSMLEEHSDLRIRIEGHTDSDGDDAYNLELSERRAASVRAFLIDKHGIEEVRLEAAGFGESRPAAENKTAEGKQQNRRVELVRL
jgi:outer membrane protein OmpA-like peptidoglycan-associated protein